MARGTGKEPGDLASWDIPAGGVQFGLGVLLGGGWPGSMLALLLAPHLPGLSGLSAFGERGSKRLLRKPGFFHLT